MADLETCIETPSPVRLDRLVHEVIGPTSFEPTSRALWWATHTPDGAGTIRLHDGGTSLTASAWGPGAGWMIDRCPALVGLSDRTDEFCPPPGVVRDLWRRMGPLPFGRTERVYDAVLMAVLHQKVQTVSAERSMRLLRRAHGDPAPGPADLRLNPLPQRLAELSSAELHRYGIERRRADTLRRVAREAGRLERSGHDGPDALDRRLLSVDGVGPWTSAIVRRAALGDPDAVAVGDFHIPNMVCWALAGEARGSDDRMLELLEPYRHHRGRVIALLRAGGRHAPRYGPRLSVIAVDRMDGDTSPSVRS